jgi:hypothetical protein
MSTLPSEADMLSVGIKDFNERQAHRGGTNPCFHLLGAKSINTICNVSPSPSNDVARSFQS